MEYCPDNYDQWRKLDNEQAEREKNAPKCAECGAPLTSWAYHLGGEFYCEACVKESKEYVE